MFTYDVIQKFNDTEINIYKFIVANLDKIPYMTIRELSDKLNISTSTVLRFCDKVNCSGYNEFKEKIKEYLKTANIKPPMEDLEELQHYFHGVNTSAFEEKIRTAVEKIRASGLIAFIGIGSSGTLAKYGARFFSNLGKFAVGLEDNYYPICDGFPPNTVIIALSESGESKELINMISAFLQKGYYIMNQCSLQYCVNAGFMGKV